MAANKGRTGRVAGLWRDNTLTDKSDSPTSPKKKEMEISAPISSTHHAHLGADGTVITKGEKPKEWDKLSDALNDKLKQMGGQGLSDAEVKYILGRMSKRPTGNAVNNNNATASKPGPPAQGAGAPAGGATAKPTARPQLGAQVKIQTNSGTSKPGPNPALSSSTSSSSTSPKPGSSAQPGPSKPVKRDNRQTLVVKGEIMHEQYEMYKDRCAKLEFVADKAREMSKQIKAMEEQLKHKDELNKRAGALLKQERDEHNQTKDKLLKMGEKAKQILTKSGNVDNAKSELAAMMGESNESSDNKAKHKQELAKITDELEREKRNRQEKEREISEMDSNLQQYMVENQMLKDTLEEQKALIARLENGLNLAMDQLDFMNSQGEGGAGAGLGGDGFDDLYGGGGGGGGRNSMLEDLDTESLEDPEMLQLLAEVLMNNRKSMVMGDIADMFEKMDG